MLIYGKKIIKNHLQNQERLEVESSYTVSQGLKVYKVCSADHPRVTFDILRQGQICVHIQNVEKPFTQNVLKTKGWNLKCMIKEVKLFSYNLYLPLSYILFKIV